MHAYSCYGADKYLYKGPDRAGLRGRTSDEIHDYQVYRYFGAAESCWRLLGFPLYYSQPPVNRLPMHLEGEQQVRFRPGMERRVALRPSTSALTRVCGYGEKRPCAYKNSKISRSGRLRKTIRRRTASDSEAKTLVYYIFGSNFKT